MVSRAAELCGLETEMDNAAVRNMLAQFPDYMSSAEWARPSWPSATRRDPEPNGVERPAPGRCDPSRGCSDAFNLLSSAELL